MKNKEISGLSEKELVEKIKEDKASLNKKTLNHGVSPVDNPSEIRVQRRTIARMITEINKRKKDATKASKK